MPVNERLARTPPLHSALRGSWIPNVLFEYGCDDIVGRCVTSFPSANFVDTLPQAQGSRALLATLAQMTLHLGPVSRPSYISGEIDPLR